MSIQKYLHNLKPFYCSFTEVLLHTENIHK